MGRFDTYEVIEIVNDELARIRRNGETDLWSKRRLRKPVNCAATGRLLQPGDDAYGPVGNQAYRGERIGSELVGTVSADSGKESG